MNRREREKHSRDKFNTKDRDPHRRKRTLQGTVMKRRKMEHFFSGKTRNRIAGQRWRGAAIWGEKPHEVIISEGPRGRAESLPVAGQRRLALRSEIPAGVCLQPCPAARAKSRGGWSLVEPGSTWRFASRMEGEDGRPGGVWVGMDSWAYAGRGQPEDLHRTGDSGHVDWPTDSGAWRLGLAQLLITPGSWGSAIGVCG